MNKRVIYRFGPFRLDTAQRTLQREDEYVPLPLKVFSCLAYLLEHRDRAVSRDEMLSAIWGTEHLSAGVVPQTILQLRQALGDSGEDQKYIETMRGFGYRWKIPVETGEETDTAATVPEPVAPAPEAPAPAGPEPTAEPAPAPAPAATEPAAAPVGTAPAGPSPSPTRRTRPLLRWAGALMVALIVVAGVVLYQGRESRQPFPATEGSVALLLPVTVTAGADDGWVRLGVMDFISDQLRAAGLTMVASDTVIAVLRQSDDKAEEGGFESLTRATGARLVLAANAQKLGSRWVVSLKVVKGPTLNATGEAEDVIEAARIASDQMATQLGLKASAGSDQAWLPPDVVRLSKQIQAALLAGDVAMATARVQDALPQLRRHPQIRLLEGHVALVSSRGDTAQEIIESLLKETENDPVVPPTFRAQALYTLGAIHAERGDWAAAQPLVEQAVTLASGGNTPLWEGKARTVLSALALNRGDLAAATTQLAHARRAYYSSGDLRGLASVDLVMGQIEANRDRPAFALRNYQHAAERLQALGYGDFELDVRTRMQDASLDLLDRAGAEAQQPRVRQLAARTQSPVNQVNFRLMEAALDEANGRLADAREHLDAVLEIAQPHPGLEWAEGSAATALVGLARLERWDGRCGRAMELVSLAAPKAITVQSHVGIWLTRLRCQLAGGDLAGARASVEALDGLADRKQERIVTISAHLARAELAVAEGQDALAEAEYKQAVGLADAGQVPAHLLSVICSYLPWLLERQGGAAPDLERAVQLAGRVAPYADHWYEAALAQLRVYHARGDTAAWRAALDHTRRLAGERQVPRALQAPPVP